MSILSSDTVTDETLFTLQADRLLLSSLANTLHESFYTCAEAAFQEVSERVNREMEVLADRLAHESTDVVM